MNGSKFMDKQIMELSGSSQPAGEFFDLINPQEDRRSNGTAGGGSIKEGERQEAEILPSYDFHPIRVPGSSSAPTSGGGSLGGSWPSWGSVDSKLASSNLKTAGILEPHELTKVNHEKDKSTYDIGVIAEIDRTVKKYADNLMNALEGVSSRLSKLESRTHHLENSVDELKVAIGNNNGSTDGRLRQIENVLKEVHAGVQILQDKQNIMETQLHLAQLKASKGEQQPPETSKTGQLDSRQHEVSPPQQPIQQPYQHPGPQAQPTMLPALPMPNAPLPVPQQNPPPKIPPQLPQSQIPSVPSLPQESYFPSAAQQAEAPHQQYQGHIQQPQAAPPPLPPQQQQHYQPSPQLPQYSPPPQSQQPVGPSPQLPPTMSQHHEESVPYMPPPMNYPPSIRQPVSFPQPLSGPPQQFYGPNSGIYEPPTSKPSSGLPPFSSGYGPPTSPGYSDSYGYSGLPSGPSSSATKPLPFAPSVPTGGSSNYPRLPTAQILPQAAPTGSGSGGGSSGARVPIDDVVEKVATMGFSRDQVRATVRKLTENGQSVDLNVVLDKLMNDGEIRPQKGWFGR